MKQAQTKALESIKRLFAEAEKNPAKSKRYIQLAKKIGTGENAKIPKNLKKLCCKKCLSLFNSKNSQTRIKKGFKTIKCLECGNIKRIKL